jgi:Tol biopolymer transport system component
MPDLDQPQTENSNIDPIPDEGKKGELPRPEKGRSRWVWGCCCLLPSLLLGGVVVTLLGLTLSGVLSGPFLRGNGNPDWSPDGKSIVFNSPRDGNMDIFVMDSDGFHVQQLTKDSFALLYLGSKSPQDVLPVWSPDGSRIAFTSGRGSNLLFGNLDSSVVDYKFYVMDWNGKNVIELPFEASVALSGEEPSLSWAPDSKRIAYESVNGNWDIYIANLDGSDLIQLTNNANDDRRPLISPDGQKIVFASNPRGTWDIYVMDSDGSRRTRLTDGPADNLEYDWSPDSKRIVFTSYRNDNWDIYVMDADGSNVVQLTHDPASDFQPSWSPDGSRIAFVSTRNGEYGDIYSLQLDGRQVVQLTNYQQGRSGE